MEQKHRKFYFSTSFLVIVIVIILVLFAILPVSFRPIGGCTKNMKTKSTLSAIVTAVKMYETTYGELPWSHQDTDKIFGDANIVEYNTFIELLTSSPGPNTEHVTNTRKIRFLDVPPNYQEKGFTDAWGKPFKVILDTNYDMGILIEDKVVNGNILVYSYGKNGKDENGENDDIGSWK